MSAEPSTTDTTATPSDCPHPEAVGTRWGDPISAERQAELQAILDAWNAPGADHGARRGPFDRAGVNDEEGTLPRLSGADVRWLADQTGRSESGRVPNLHLEEANLRAAHLEGTFLSAAHLEGADLYAAHLEGAHLVEAHLEGASLVEAHLEQAHLYEAHLEGANLRQAHLEHADLRGTWLDKTTGLNEAALTGVALDQISFDGANLAVVDWSAVTILGDEVRADKRVDEHGKPKDPTMRLNEYKAAVRANRLLAVALRSQGLNEDADRYAYRAQLLQSHVWARQGKWLANLGNNLLYVLAGYGYKPTRTILVYVATIVAFATAYLLLGHNMTPSLTSLDALVFSITSFHGRGFFPGGLHLDDPVTVLAAGEAVIGLLIEISFIATFTQRFFGAK
jgi:hypothetical protein